MAVNRTPVLKRCRSLDLDPLYLGIDKKSRRKAKNAGRKISEYGLQLREKQKAKFIYGVLEKPFRNYYKKAEKQKGMTGENLMITLELRLDNVIFRLGFARTRKEARQIVDHKHVLVNGKQVNIPSYLVKAGDTIEIKENKKGWRTGKGFSSQVPWRTTIPGHNHYVQYNRQMEKSQLRHWENWDAGTARIQDRSTIRKHRKSNTRHRPYPRGTTDACTGSH